MEKAQKEIMELRTKLREFENKILEAQSSVISKIDPNKDFSLMSIEGGGFDKSNISTVCTNKDHPSNNDFTIMFLRE